MCDAPPRAARGGVAGQLTLTAADGTAIAEECPSVRAVTPFVPASGGQVIGGNVNWSPAEMPGAGVDYPIVRTGRSSSASSSPSRRCRGRPRCA